MSIGEVDTPIVPVLKCHAMVRKEMNYGPPIDEECGGAVESGHAGLCK